MARAFKEEALDIRHAGLNAAEILELTVSEAIAHFDTDKKVQSQLAPLAQVGLDYVRAWSTTEYAERW